MLEGLLRTLRQIYADRALTWRLDAVPEGLAFAGEAQDLQEMLGNVLDNAGKWARTQVRVGAELCAGRIVLSVDDDGKALRRMNGR